MAELLGCESMMDAQNSSHVINDTHFAMVATKGKGIMPKLKTFTSKGNNLGQQRRSIPASSGNHLPTPPVQQISDVSPPIFKEKCQICDKTSHKALDCYHGFDYSYQGRHPPSQLAAMVSERNV